MNGKVVAGFVVACIAGAWLWYIQMGQWNAPAVSAENHPPIAVGDTQDRVDEVLGLPGSEVSREGNLIRSYAGYEVSLSNHLVTGVSIRPVEPEKER